MTPVPLELPLRPAEAAAVANLVFDLAERRPLTPELRTRLAARSAVLRLAAMTPHFGSLARDPVHPSTYYLAVDGTAGEPMLLHMALANAPTGSLFAKPLLVGRMPRAGGPEMVVNCLPFGPADRDALETFASATDPRLLPRPLSPRPAIAVESDRPEVDFPLAFEAFRALNKRTGRNLAALSGGPGAYAAGLWSAIRAGWRDGYGMGTAIPTGDADETKEAIRRAAGCSRFTVGMRAPFEPALAAAAAAYECIRQTRSALKTGRSFDFELSFEGASQPTSPAVLDFCLQWMKERGQAVQLASPEWASADPAYLAELAAVAQRHACGLSVTFGAGDALPARGDIGRAAPGRLNARILSGQPDLAAAIQQAAAVLLP